MCVIHFTNPRFQCDRYEVKLLKPQHSRLETNKDEGVTYVGMINFDLRSNSRVAKFDFVTYLIVIFDGIVLPIILYWHPSSFPSYSIIFKVYHASKKILLKHWETCR